jgi:serine/threonine-protein kinase
MQLPARIGKYELEEFLGGGMSQVYRARDTVIGRTVAVKILIEPGCEDAEAKARFLAEARMAGNLSHDNILRIYDFGEDEQHHPFMVMEFLRGEDLRHAIQNGHTGDLRNKLKIALQVARALAYIHTQKIVHRDIKPENVHINTAGVAKLMDFGIAKTEGLAMTRTGYVLGTPYYMAPEQVTGQGITEQVDVYAFGVLLFELLAGVKPIQGDAVERIFYSILNEPLQLEPLYQANVPQSLCELIARCTAKKPQDRPQGFPPLIAELERLIADQDAPTIALTAMPQVEAAPLPAPTPAPTPAPAPAPTRPAWLLPAVLVAIAGLAAGLYFATRPERVAEIRQRPVAEVPERLLTPTGEMVLVPAGDFLFGKDRQKISLPAYYIDKTEVTNAAYRLFCEATHRALPGGFPADKPGYPVVNVTLGDAREFARWAGKRLPNSKEWEKAARGKDGFIFPWGDQNDPSRANLNSKGLQPADAFTSGASPYGALQMAGNAWEFVEELTTPSEETIARFQNALKPPPGPDEAWYLTRGASFEEPGLFDSILWDSAKAPIRWKTPSIGFRCVKGAQ